MTVEYSIFTTDPSDAVHKQLDCYEFRCDGYYYAASGVDIYEAKYAGTITSVVLRREVAGTSSSSVVDLLINGASAWTVPSNRPTVAFGAGNAARKVTPTNFPLPDTTAISVGDRLELTMVQAEGGDPQDLVLQVFVTRT
jgi:hypothetical protein